MLGCANAASMNDRRQARNVGLLTMSEVDRLVGTISDREVRRLPVLIAVP